MTTKRKAKKRSHHYSMDELVEIEGWGMSVAELKQAAIDKATTKRKTTKTIDDQLRSAIIKSGKTHYRLAKDTGVSTAVIDRFMTRERDVRMVTAAKLASELGLELR